MSENKRPSGVLRSVAIILMAITVFFTIVGGIGTTCVAFGAEKYDSMVGLVPYKPLYQALVFISIAAGIWGVFIVIKLVRGGANVYRNAIIMLVIGAVTAGIQTAVSQAVRGSSAPANIRFYITAFALIVFLLFRIPPIWDQMKFDQSMKKDAKKTAAGASLFVCGVVALTTYYWTGPTHLAEWIDIIRIPLLAGGWGMVLTGTALMWVARPAMAPEQQTAHNSPNPI